MLRVISAVGVVGAIVVPGGMAPAQPSQTVAVHSVANVIQVPYASIGDLVGMSPKRTMNAQLGGMFCQKGGIDICSRVQYSRVDTPSSIAKGVSDLTAKIAAATGSGPVIGEGYSLGGTVVESWLQQFGRGGDGLPSADDLLFVLTGKPNKNGSAMTPMDVDTIYRLLSIVRQYDGVADLPDDQSNFLAVLNSIVGFFLVHTDYTKVDAFDPANTVYKLDGITYVFVPTRVAPLIASWEFPMKLLGLGGVFEEWNKRLIENIEKAYDRSLPDGAVMTTVVDEFPELVDRVPASVRAQLRLTPELLAPNHDVVEDANEPAGPVEGESQEEPSAPVEPESAEVVSEQPKVSPEPVPTVEVSNDPLLAAAPPESSAQAEGDTPVTETVSTADTSADSSVTRPVKEPKKPSVRLSTRSSEETSELSVAPKTRSDRRSPRTAEPRHEKKVSQDTGKDSTSTSKDASSDSDN